MNNYIVLESEKNKERFIMKPITDKLLMLYRVKRRVVNGEMINYNQLGEIFYEKIICIVTNARIKRERNQTTYEVFESSC